MMDNNKIPLQEISIDQLYNGENAYWEIPIYQRNYAWEKDEIFALVQDVFDAFRNTKNIYYIGTLVSFYKGDNIFEIIDGQQRLTTINLILKALNISIKNPLTYRARKKSDNTLKKLPLCDSSDQDQGLINGYRFAENAIKEISSSKQLESFKKYFLNNVHIIHYQVPRDIDLNHYFEIMNSRGEQLEKHEIIKARLLAALKNDRTLGSKFNTVWECCSEMNVYIQQKISKTELFGKDLQQFCLNQFDELPEFDNHFDSEAIDDLLKSETYLQQNKKNEDKKDSFQPIIDFSNFLLMVLKLTIIRCHHYNEEYTPTIFNLDDKELINEFDKINLTAEFAKCFCYNLLKAKFFLDNFVVHHSCEDDTIENNPWKLQLWQIGENNRQYPQNLLKDKEEHLQDKALQLLSMFEVSFTAHQRKNYLLYVLLYLFDWYSPDKESYKEYVAFLEQLAHKYFNDVYLKRANLNEINVPLPGSFDNEILNNCNLNCQYQNNIANFEEIYGAGIDKESAGIPLFVFNYLDYKIWQKYADDLRGEKAKKGSVERNKFFESLGCTDFDLPVFQKFYFSRTRRSLEHYFPQANADGINGNPSQIEINCLGNYAMIGSAINSSGSNLSPRSKLDRYLNNGKVKQISVASLKFMIMMQVCQDKQQWSIEEIRNHQAKMLEILKN